MPLVLLTQCGVRGFKCASFHAFDMSSNFLWSTTCQLPLKFRIILWCATNRCTCARYLSVDSAIDRVNLVFTLISGCSCLSNWLTTAAFNWLCDSNKSNKSILKIKCAYFIIIWLGKNQWREFFLGSILYQDEVHPSTCHSGIEWVSICENIFKRGSIVPEISSQTIPKLVYNIIAHRIIWSKVIIFINYQQIMNS